MNTPNAPSFPEPTLAPPGERAKPFLLTLDEAAARFGVSTLVLSGMIRRGLLPVVDLGRGAPDGGRYVNPENVRAALAQAAQTQARARRRFLGLLAKFPELQPIAIRLCEVLRQIYADRWWQLPEMLDKLVEQHDRALDEAKTLNAYTGLECVLILQARSVDLGLESTVVPSPRAVGATLAMLALDDLTPWALYETKRRNPRHWTVRPKQTPAPEEPR